MSISTASQRTCAAPAPFLAVLRGALFLSAAFGAGCHGKAQPEPAPASTFEVPKANASGAPSASTATPLAPGETLFGRLAREANNRPRIKPGADDIFPALEHAGAAIPQKEQTMGSTYKAGYCIGGYTADRVLAVNVCEYSDDAAAAAGRLLSKSLFPNLTNREVWSHKATTLTIVQLKPEGAPLEKKLVDAYMAT